MRTSWGWRLLYRSIQWGEWVAVLGLAAGAAVLKLDATSPPTWLTLSKPAIDSLQAFAQISGIILGPALVLLKFWRGRIGHPGTWAQVQAILDQLQDDLFGDNDPRHHHQVTLFRHRQVCMHPRNWRSSRWWWWGSGRWPWSGWLSPVARSGHAKKASRSTFLAPDDAENAEGIAGATWAFGRKGKIPAAIEDLPMLTAASPETDVQAYAASTWVSVEWVRWYLGRGKTPPRSYAGRPIEVQGKVWGVLVIDSRNAKLPYMPTLEKTTNSAAKLLGVVLKGT